MIKKYINFLINCFSKKQKNTDDDQHHVIFTYDSTNGVTVDYKFAPRQHEVDFISEVGQLLYFTQANVTTARLAQIIMNNLQKDTAIAVLDVWKTLLREQNNTSRNEIKGLPPTQVFSGKPN